MKNEKGLTLVEVLAAVVLISIVLMGFMALFGTTNKLAVTNSEKLVIINLADANLERLKSDPVLYFKNTGYAFPPTTLKSGVDFTRTETINGKNYLISIDFTQNTSELNLSIYNVSVTAKSPSSNLSSTVEGYLPYVKP
ncbi:hypothetical protein BN1080_02032 [Planococcus massiliensis]|uniref:Prepilin-type N-terminal cleavage/methylation domain-containing protein n=1 Tax=Planococcus massiliensis TaxID=1499687 RepID=A0A098ELA1_9BACL|nr:MULTISPECIES: prepilin-type N-terminal cleavage/methylation domain-containing protein [Planococcus]MCJ1908684.1 type II secretion system GspH family protein [Planococcus ruber]CEG23089.1 hypothetical protein BN1080_02032 [Planococcus massiliensis]